MAITIDPYVAQLAQIASQMCGLDINVILAQWQVEEGVGSANWPGNNPAGITPGNSAVDALGTGELTSGGFVVFPTPAAGAKGYATLYNTDPNYANVRAAIKTGNPTNELNAIIQSPWDTGHYQNGVSLYAAYSAVTGSHYTAPSGLTVDPSKSYAVDNSNNNQNSISFPTTNYSVVADSQRFGNILYGRKYRILVSNKSGIALDVSELHCTFDIQYVVNQTPPFNTITIYNLNPETENFLLNYGDHIVVEAGYEGSQYGVIFEGDVIEPIRDKPDNVTYRLTINALASDLQLNQAFAAFTLNRGQTARSVVQNLANKATVTTTLGDISPQLSEAKLPRGKVVFGLTRDYLRQIAQANNMALYSHDGKINLVHASDPPTGEIINLTPESGLISQPTQQSLGINFQCLLNPAIKIGTMVHIDNSLIQQQTYYPLSGGGTPPKPLDSAGIYRVVGVEHIGDTRGNDWYTKCTCLSQAGGIPGALGDATQTIWGN